MKKNKREDYGYNVRDKFMLNNKNDFKYETPYKGPFDITHFWTDGTVTLQYGAKKTDIIYIGLKNIHLIQTLRILLLKMMYANINI